MSVSWAKVSKRRRAGIYLVVDAHTQPLEATGLLPREPARLSTPVSPKGNFQDNAPAGEPVIRVRANHPGGGPKLADTGDRAEVLFLQQESRAASKAVRTNAGARKNVGSLGEVATHARPCHLHRHCPASPLLPQGERGGNISSFPIFKTLL